jgi:hypothetical protein
LNLKALTHSHVTWPVAHHTRLKVQAEQSKRRPTLAHCHTKPKEIHREIRAKKLPQLETNRMQA